jgi:hypothetical protein
VAIAVERFLCGICDKLKVILYGGKYTIRIRGNSRRLCNELAGFVGATIATGRCRGGGRVYGRMPEQEQGGSNAKKPEHNERLDANTHMTMFLFQEQAT